MDRWLTGELLGPLLFGIAAFTAVTLSVGVLFELVRKVAAFALTIFVTMASGAIIPSASSRAPSRRS